MQNNGKYIVTIAHKPNIVYPFNYKGLDLFAHRYPPLPFPNYYGKDWRVTELNTGSYISGTYKTRKLAIEKAKECIDKKDNDFIAKTIENIELLKSLKFNIQHLRERKGR